MSLRIAASLIATSLIVALVLSCFAPHADAQTSGRPVLQAPIVTGATRDTPVGVWMTKGGKARIRIEPCGSALCGRIVWIPKPNNADGTPKRDKKNPDPKRRSQSMVGLQILRGFRQDPKNPTRWIGGRIYNATDGSTYRSILTVRPDGRLNVRGYVAVPLLGGSQNWTRYRD